MAAEPAAEAAARRPELGLALSGGGFRAAFFHVGVLARLAETGGLRGVEVLSTVSGGSIVGALYYLVLKDLLESVPDADIRDEHYLEAVGRVEEVLYEGVCKHVRARTYSDLGKNFRMRRPDYSRSDRIGELYDELFYRPVWEHPRFGSKPAPRQFSGAIRMRELLIHPPGEGADFSPLRHNGHRRSPVPIVLINSTSLNTGHGWRFQAVEMGENPRSEADWVAVDKNARLLSTRYDEIVERQQDIELGLAVAASACVPALFQPLALSGLFERRDGDATVGIRVQLVDGGVHDNQGLRGLLDTGCERLIVSDASGQMLDLDDPSTRVPSAAGRSSSIVSDRLREEELVDAVGRPTTVLVHLRKGLPALGYPPLGPKAAAPEAPRSLGAAAYGIAPDAQELLARVRTDLDSFTEVEAYSLALCGHEMTRVEDPAAGSLQYAWRLGAVDGLRAELKSPGPEYLRQLAVAKQRFFKGSSLNGALRAGRIATIVLVVAAVGAIAYGLRGPASGGVPGWSIVLAILVPAAFVALYLKQSMRNRALRRLADGIYTWLMPALMAPFLYLAARTMLFTNRWFLAAGRAAPVVARDKRSP